MPRLRQRPGVQWIPSLWPPRPAYPHNPCRFRRGALHSQQLEVRMTKPYKRSISDSAKSNFHPVAEAAEVVRRVVDHGESLDRLLVQSNLSGQRSEPVFREIAYGTCRHFPHIDWHLGMLLERPLRKKDRILHFLMAVGVYQIEHMRTPDYAVLNETVRAASSLGRDWARKLINAVLRNYLRERNPGKLPEMPEHQVHAFTEFLFDLIRSDWPERYLEIAKASNARPPLTLRVNLAKTSRDKAIQALKENAMACTATRDSPAGLTLSSPVPVKQIPGFCQGEVSVQDESAQLAALELGCDTNLNVLDACAAPGGKTTHLIELLGEGRSITAVDLDSRCTLIHQNLARLGLNANVVAGDLLKPETWWDGNPYDRILLDVPCSGSGVIRRHPDIKYRRKPRDLDTLHDLQASLLASVWKLLCPGGYVLYVTCSILHRENDGVIADFVAQGDDREVLAIEKIPGVATRFGMQRLPGFGDGDGFYYCKIRKPLRTAGE